MGIHICSDCSLKIHHYSGKDINFMNSPSGDEVETLLGRVRLLLIDISGYGPKFLLGLRLLVLDIVRDIFIKHLLELKVYDWPD